MNATQKRARWSALIVDDEPLARTSLRALLARESEEITILEARNAEEAISVIRGQDPDVVFLDVQMPDMSGFDVVRQVGIDSMPIIIFVTAHDQFAIQAFEINAVDYLLKPVAEERFAEALNRARSQLGRRGGDNQHLASLLQAIVSPPRTLARFAVRSGGKTFFVNSVDVRWIQAAENYVQLHTATAGHLVHATMQSLLGVLDPEVFVRIHRSIIVNIGHVRQIEAAAHGDHLLMLDNGVQIQSSRTYAEVIRKLMSNRP